MSRPPKCNRPHDHECYTLGHANNTSTNPLSLYGRECPVHGPTARAKERALERRGGCKDCGWWQADEHYSTCPQHLRNQKPKPAPPEPKPDAYVSPHSVNALGEQPIKIPVFDYTEDENGTLHARQTGFEIDYPHNTWINARESYAKGDDTLEHVLQYVTETNPPPGPPIAVYKPAAEPVLVFHPLLYVLLILGVVSVAIGCLMLLV